MHVPRRRAISGSVTTYSPKREPATVCPGAPSATDTGTGSCPVAHGRPTKDAAMTRKSAARPRSIHRSVRLMGILHDLPPREHDAEEEQDGHGPRVDEDLHEADELRTEEDVDRADRDQGDREPQH